MTAMPWKMTTLKVFETQHNGWVYLLSIHKDIDGVQVANLFSPDHIESNESLDCRACKNIQCIGDHKLDSTLHISSQQLISHT